ncbi:HemK [Desulforapulum autotrophicum HRM2]|uniref:Release factor glutamine methyltransferase n=1 Tax=Desulforapulum autotrophicum (strain ATCC 43914 / DSM 3382 / VKM B-1955 / HRM2) TaxID=177437 RepID=C0QB16_DESAH|nr:peptide chain release factor N(5)-glutamine methyltransferase [Desulforapulum autotrophicum]ACN14815.1 HemK [Desulforapulum autotrophicum HRM2]
MGADRDLWTIRRILAWTEGYFEEKEIDSPRLTAEILLSHALSIKRLDLYLQHDRPLNRDELAAFRQLIERRGDREPVAYITGTKGFWESEFTVAPGVLIPRPDTEVLVEQALEFLARKNISMGRVLELGVGSGAVIISIAKANPGLYCFATDISLIPLEVAAFNVKQELELPNLSFVAGSWFSPFNGRAKFDLIVSNPPYIPTGDIQGLQPEVSRFEPSLALDGGEDGLDCIRLIMAKACDHLVPGGVLLMETGSGQRRGVEKIFKECPGFSTVEFFNDYAGLHRVVRLGKKDCQ